MAKKHHQQQTAPAGTQLIKVPQQPPQQININPLTAASQLQLANAGPLISAIEQERKSRVIALTYNESPPHPSILAFAVLPALEQLLSEIGSVSKLDLVLRTTGGHAEVPWRIVSLLREFTDELGVIVSRIAFSGGCHIALSADDLVMGPLSALGSVDPTRQHLLLPRDPATNQPIPTSVQDLKHCVRFIKDQLGQGESYEKQNLALIVSELFKYVNPLAVGALEQSYNLARLITKKVLNTRKSKLKDDHVERIVDLLSGEYFSHAYMISRMEVESDLKLPVTKPDARLSAAIANFENLYLGEFQKVVPVAPNARELIRAGGFIQTTSSGWLIAQVLRQDGAAINLLADPWIKFR